VLDLNKLLCASPEQYGQCLAVLEHDLKCSQGLSAELRYHYVDFDGDGEPKFQILAQMLVHSIITYCFGAKKRENLTAVEAAQLFTSARNLFRKYENAGQAGEVLIYFLLESVLGAPQILQKMPVTTNPAEERKGTDGLHAKWNPELGLLDLFFAESKLYQSFSKALVDAFASMEKIHTTPKKAHELFLATHNLQHLGADCEDDLMKFLNGQVGTKIRTNHACLIGFDWDEYKCLDDGRRAQFVAEFLQRYRIEAVALRDKIDGKLQACAIKHLRFEFFLLPFRSVEDFRAWSLR
jgi:hypothetical protein